MTDAAAAAAEIMSATCAPAPSRDAVFAWVFGCRGGRCNGVLDVRTRSGGRNNGPSARGAKKERCTLYPHVRNRFRTWKRNYWCTVFPSPTRARRGHLLFAKHAMVIGHCLARTQADAVQFCLLVDAMVVMLHLWNAMTSHEERDVNFEGSGRGVWAGWGAAIGLAATVTIGRDSDTPNMARYARSALMLATFCFAVDFISSIGGLMSAKHEIDEGLVDVSSWFWPLSFLNVVIWLVITINHLLLAHFSFKQGKEEGSHHSVVPNEVI